MGETGTTFQDALAALEESSRAPATTRNEKRERKLRVDLAMLKLDEAALLERAARDDECAKFKRNISERVALAKRVAREALKP